MFRFMLLLTLIAIPTLGHAEETSYFREPDFVLEGKTAEALSAEWWQWAMAGPAETSPVRDRRGVHCAVGQQGSVWFLAGGFGSSKIRRRCTIPKDVHIFFPIINMVYWPRSADVEYSCEQARANASVNNESALALRVELDGVALESTKAHRAATKACFNVFARARGGYDGYPSASDGYWVLLRPLPEGEHRLSFSGRYDSPGQLAGRMVQDIEYEITVR